MSSRAPIIKKTANNRFGKNIEKLELSYAASVSVKCASHFVTYFAVPQKFNHKNANKQLN